MDRNRSIPRVVVLALAVAGMVILLPRPVMAHCDGLDGPVVAAARAALEKDNVNLALIWVRGVDEPEIRQAFARTMAVRKLGGPAAELADAYFFETLVRIHRVGEGAAYTGLKPAGRDLGPAIPAADLALSSGDVTALTALLAGQVREGLIETFTPARAGVNYQPDNVAAGREYVERYVMFIHYVEAMSDAATHPAKGHYPESATPRDRK